MKLHFILADTHQTRMRLIHENEWVPYKKRVVTIELTPEQSEQIRPRLVGHEGNSDCFEEILEVFMEEEEDERSLLQY